jgi:hypothetical protein
MVHFEPIAGKAAWHQIGYNKALVVVSAISATLAVHATHITGLDEQVLELVAGYVKLKPPPNGTFPAILEGPPDRLLSFPQRLRLGVRLAKMGVRMNATYALEEVVRAECAFHGVAHLAGRDDIARRFADRII